SGRGADGESVFDPKTVRDGAEETDLTSPPPATPDPQSATVDTPSFALIEPIVGSDPPAPDRASEPVTRREEVLARPRDVGPRQEEPARSASAGPTTTVASPAATASQEAQVEVPSPPPALLPSLNVTVPTDT